LFIVLLFWNCRQQNYRKKFHKNQPPSPTTDFYWLEKLQNIEMQQTIKAKLQIFV